MSATVKGLGQSLPLKRFHGDKPRFDDGSITHSKDSVGNFTEGFDPLNSFDHLVRSQINPKLKSQPA